MATKRELRILDALAQQAIMYNNLKNHLLATDGTSPESSMSSWHIGIQYAEIQRQEAFRALESVAAIVENRETSWIIRPEQYLLENARS